MLKIRRIILGALIGALSAASLPALADAQSVQSQPPSPMTMEQKKEKAEEILRSGAPLQMYNFVTNKKEVIQDPVSLTKDKALEYLPPIDEVKQIFEIYVNDHPVYASLIKTYTDLQQSLAPTATPGTSSAPQALPKGTTGPQGW